MVRRISDKYKASTVSHLKYNNNDITDVKDICNTLAEQFVFNSPSDNYSHRFNRYRLTIERKTIDFDTNDHYSYNDVFTLHELKQAIKISRDTSPGIDAVHYQLPKHLPEDSDFFYLIVILKFVSRTYSLILTHKKAGVPQGSILSITLFSLKIISIVFCLLPDIKCSLYVDDLADLAIYYSSSHMPSIERKLQQSLNRLIIIIIIILVAGVILILIKYSAGPF